MAQSRFDAHALAALILLPVIFGALGCGQSETPLDSAGQQANADSAVVDPQSTDSDPVPFRFHAPNLTAAEIGEGWISLFDGASLFGWDVPQQTNWRVEDEVIVADDGEPSLLTTPFEFDDFELRCDFHLQTGGNSGVFLRTAANASDPGTDTYELNICDSHDSFPTGSLVARHHAENVPAVEDQWHTFRVRCDGMNIQVWLDSAQIVDFTDSSQNSRTSGTIGLQMNGGRIAFRNVFIKPTRSDPLFDGSSLEGWTEVDGSQSEFSVAEGAIHVSGGPGFLQTNSTHDDFILQLEARANGDALNGGVFFRAISGTADAPSHGYEMQIQNEFKNGDRTQPVDSGTGAIFRRAAARYVVASDREWLTATLIAQGNRFATWVNGYQVVDWQDDRESDENPRRGKRLAAGHISLQGHDRATDLDFRSIRIHDFRKKHSGGQH